MNEPTTVRITHPLPTLAEPVFTLSEIGGLRAAGVAAGIKASGRPDVAVLVAGAPIACAGVFTQNLFPAAPVQVSRQHLASNGGLVRTALFGNDPNWGRFVSQVGNAKSVRSVAGLRCVLQGVTVFADGAPTPFDRAALSAAMRAEDVALDVFLAEGDGEATLMTSDLGYRYVEVNAEYTT